jgi:hypothetical protein
MSESMVRKQVYLRREHDRKLKALASVRGCTEAEVIREAIDRLPDPEGDFVARLEAAGLLVPKRDSPDLPRGAELEKLDAEFDAWLASRTEPLGLSEALLAERRESW